MVLLSKAHKGEGPRGLAGCPRGYLMHNVPHELSVGHTGQLQVNWNTSGDVRNGGHNLRREEGSSAIRGRSHARGKKGARLRGSASGRCLFCIIMKALSLGVTTASRQGTLFPKGRHWGHRLRAPRTAPVCSRSQPSPGGLRRVAGSNRCRACRSCGTADVKT